MYPVTVQLSLLVAFLLSLKGSYIHSADVICAPVGSTALLSCPKCSDEYTWTLGRKRIHPKSDRNKYSVNKKNCSLTIKNLNKMDRGTYRYCETDDDDSEEDCKDFCTYTLYVTDLQVNADVDRATEGQKVTLTCHTRITTVSSVRSLQTRAVTLTYNTISPLPDVMIDSTGIIVLSSLLVLLTLMMIGAAVWRRRKRRHEGNKSQSRNPSLRFSVLKNIPAAATEHQRQKKEEFDHKNDVGYCYVQFSKNDAHQPARVDDVQYAAVKGPGRSDAPY